MRSQKIKMRICFLLVVLFSAIWILTITGHLSFTGAYGIRHIDCNLAFPGDQLFIIDNDKTTTWGLSENHEPGECFYIHFRAPRSIRSIEIINAEYEKEPTAKIKVCISDDGQTWIPASCEITCDRERMHILFTPALKECEHIGFVYDNEQPGHWPITEVKINA